MVADWLAYQPWAVRPLPCRSAARRGWRSRYPGERLLGGRLVHLRPADRVVEGLLLGLAVDALKSSWSAVCRLRPGSRWTGPGPEQCRSASSAPRKGGPLDRTSFSIRSSAPRAMTLDWSAASLAPFADRGAERVRGLAMMLPVYTRMTSRPGTARRSPPGGWTGGRSGCHMSVLRSGTVPAVAAPRWSPRPPRLSTVCGGGVGGGLRSLSRASRARCPGSPRTPRTGHARLPAPG